MDQNYAVRYQDESHEESFETEEFKAPIDPEKARFPVCITWTPIPFISWLLPCIGHTGICTSNGVIHDFAGPYYVSIDDFAFGQCYKYV